VCFFWLKLLIIIIIGKVVITILFKVSSLFVDIGKEGFFFNWPSLSRDAKKLGLILVLFTLLQGVIEIVHSFALHQFVFDQGF
jgi:hypothetical protein